MGEEQEQELEEYPQYPDYPGATLRVHGGGGETMLATLGQASGLDVTTLDSHVQGAACRARLSDQERLAREVSRRREQDLEKRARIFDAKRRTIGVDKEALDAQVAERDARRLLEKQQRRQGDTDLLIQDRKLKQLEAEKRHMRHDLERECREYGLMYLNKESATSYDLNDKAALRKCLPGRVGDEDPRCGPASMQKFNGEDLQQMERIRQQQRQQVNFIEQQRFEKLILSQQDDGANARHTQETRDLIRLRDELEENEHKLHRELTCAQQGYNRTTAAETARKKSEEQQRQMDVNAAELAFHAQDPFLTETGVDRDARGHPRKAEYKGSTRQERLQSRMIIEEQAVEIQVRNEEEKQDDRRHADLMESSRRQLILVEREKQRARRAAAEKVARENYDVLRVEQNEGTRRRNQLFTNHLGDDFFGQFGKSLA